MKKKWILIALTVVLAAAAITGGVAAAWGGPGYGWGWGRGDHEERNTAVAAKVAEILGTDEEETADAISQAQTEVRQEAFDASVANIADRVAEALGTDTDATADALKDVAQEMRSEALESKLQEAIDDGRMTEEQAQEYRDNAASEGWHGNGNSLFGIGSQDYADRVAETLDVDGPDVSDAIEQALKDIRSETLESRLQAAIDDGSITEEQADEIREKLESNEGNGFGKGGHHGGRGGWGRGHHRGRGHWDSPTATPEPTTNGDSA